MPLLAFWKSNSAAVAQLTIEQIVSNAGDGRLGDLSEAASELRQFLAEIPSERLADYAEQCLTSSFPKSGLVLQDIVNELGRRLDFAVENGRYQGTPGGIGFDGIWVNPDGGTIVVEVKTTDAYRISLDTISEYSLKLEKSGKIHSPSSVLIIVGRKDTGELEAQIRGSRHAWDMRLISVDALVSLVKLKESTETGDTGRKIRSILAPLEYTRLDALVDVLFSAARDVETTAESDTVDQNPAENGTSDGVGWRFTEPALIDAQRGRILDALQRREATTFLKRSRALFWDASHSKRVVCTVSKRYAEHTSAYWYAYHPTWNTFLAEGETSWLTLGCMDLDRAFAIPYAAIQAHLPLLNTTERADGTRYWHVKIVEPKRGTYALLLAKVNGHLPLDPFAIDL